MKFEVGVGPWVGGYAAVRLLRVRRQLDMAARLLWTISALATALAVVIMARQALTISRVDSSLDSSVPLALAVSWRGHWKTAAQMSKQMSNVTRGSLSLCGPHARQNAFL